MNRAYLNSIKGAIILVIIALGAAAWRQDSAGVFAQTAQPSPIPAAPTPANPAGFDQARAIADLTAQIKGKEQEPAETVFKNIQTFKGVPAIRVLKIMEFGYARSLGVDCTHCHVPGQWDKEDKRTKQTARDMAAMVGTINGSLLKNIKNLRGPNAIVNCTTCHRGQVKPALDLSAAKS
jgi:Photosynthetic reaction centre cytochrome C subunit